MNKQEISLHIKNSIILGDTHFGVKNFNLESFDNQMLFFDELTTYMLDNDIKYIIQLGDLFDNRKVIDINFFNIFYKKFIEEFLEKNDFYMITILGNHDIYFKDTLEVNFIKYLTKLTDNIVLLDSPLEFTLVSKEKNKKGLLVPWLIPGATIPSGSYDYIFGHFEISGFKLSETTLGHDGLDTTIFKKAKVFSGHYHLHQESNNITYVGTPYQLTWNDFGNNCGFYVLKNGAFTFEKARKSSKFIKLYYTDRLYLSSNPNTKIPITIDSINKIPKNAIVKFFVDDATNKFEEIIMLLKENNLQYTLYNETELNKIIAYEEKPVISNAVDYIDSFIEQNHIDLYPTYLDIKKDIYE
jgi:DNA repair exonuclease SbcCD nuclease subunit